MMACNHDCMQSYMQAMQPFINRDAQRRELRHLAASNRPHLALLTGRRRVGKTFLLTHTWDEEAYFYFTASKTTPEINRRQLVQTLAAWSGERLHPEDYPTWRSVFDLLFRIEREGPLVVVLDEFQYLGDGEAGAVEVASELNAVWERPRADRPILIVLAGSAVGTMEALAAGGGPLYGRFTWQHQLQPFGYWHTAEMVPFPDLLDRALAYGIFGGTPRYLNSIDVSQSLAENVSRLLLDPSGEVRLLVETALEQEEGLRDVLKYRAILQAVATGSTKRNEIANQAGLENDTALRDKLARLIDLGYIEELTNVGATANTAIRYGVADAAFRFHQQFVERNRSILERLPARAVWDKAVEPHLSDYMGHEFERIAVQAYDRRAVGLGLPLVKEQGRWEGVDRERKSVELDIVSPLLGGGVLTGEVKWHKDPVTVRVHRHHLDKLRRMKEAGQKWAAQAMKHTSPLLYVAAGGFEDGFQERAEEDGHPVTCWSLEDVYAA